MQSARSGIPAGRLSTERSVPQDLGNVAGQDGAERLHRGVPRSIGAVEGQVGPSSVRVAVVEAERRLARIGFTEVAVKPSRPRSPSGWRTLPNEVLRASTDRRSATWPSGSSTCAVTWGSTAAGGPALGGSPGPALFGGRGRGGLGGWWE